MRRHAIRGAATTLAIALAIVPRVIAAQSAARTEAPRALEPLAFLAGSCWKGSFPGRATTDEHCFEWVYGGKFLRDRHVVRGDSVPYEGETVYAWDATQRRIVWWYIARPGFHSTGDVVADGDLLTFGERVVAARPRQLRTTWRRSGADAYLVRVEELADGGVRELWSMEMRRSRPAPP